MVKMALFANLNSTKFISWWLSFVKFGYSFWFFQYFLVCPGYSWFSREMCHSSLLLFSKTLLNWLTFAYVTLPHEAPQEFATIMTIGRLVKRLFNKTVSMLVRQMVILDGRISPHWSARYLHPPIGTSRRPSAVGGGATTVLWHVDLGKAGVSSGYYLVNHLRSCLEAAILRPLLLKIVISA